MRTFRAVCISVCMLFGGPAIAGSASPAPAPPNNWSGLYVGIVGGRGSADSRVDLPPALSTGSLSGSGGIFGGTLGYNAQVGRFLVGIEGDAAWADIDSKGSDGTVFPICTGGGVGTCGAKLEFLGTLRGRLGYAILDNIVVYGTAGAAAGRLKAHVAFAGNGSVEKSASNTGWAAGGGVEARLGKNWSVKLDYLRIDLGNGPRFPHENPPLLTLESKNWTADIVRIGLNYRFDALPMWH